MYFFMGADCDADYSLVVAEVMKRLAVSIQESQKFGVERFNVRQRSELEFMK
jgi:hypothetical protein